jgi:hypothetical protein
MSSHDHPPRQDSGTLPLAGDDEYEVITSEEVDHVLDVLDQLIGDVESENVRFHLEEAAAAIYELIYADDGEEEPGSSPHQDAA